MGSTSRKISGIATCQMQNEAFRKKKLELQLFLHSKMPQSQRELKREVRKRLKQKTIDVLTGEVKTRIQVFWRKTGKRGFARAATLIHLMKDLFNIGYKRLTRMYGRIIEASETVIRHNQKIFRHIAKQWAETYINVGNYAEWSRAMSKLPKPRHLQGIQLYIDSFDLRLSGKNSTSTSDQYWSYKCNSPGLKYFTLVDANSKVRKVWGPFSPKLYDGEFLLTQVDYLHDYFKGSVLIGDSHFAKAGSCLKDPILYTKVINPCNNEQRNYNSELYYYRSRVEHPYGVLHQKFESLSQPWNDSRKEQKNTTIEAFGIINFEKN